MTDLHNAPGVDTVLCDLDGVVWLSRRPIAGAVEAIAALEEAGVSVYFVTNNSTARLADQEAALAAIGLDGAGRVLTSAAAAAALVEAGERVLVCGEEGVTEAVADRGAVVVDVDSSDLDDPDAPRVDVAIVGQHRGVRWEHLRRTVTAIGRGARFVATNDDATFPTPDGPVPGAGALVAAVATAAGIAPVIAGKPHPPMAELARRAVEASGVGAGFDAARAVVVGDRPSTDGAFAATLGCRFARVRSGVSESNHSGPEPWLDVADLAEVARIIRGSADR